MRGLIIIFGLIVVLILLFIRNSGKNFVVLVKLRRIYDYVFKIFEFVVWLNLIVEFIDGIEVIL